MADSEELTVTANPLAGGDNDNLNKQLFQPKSKKVWDTSPLFSRNSFLRTISTSCGGEFSPSSVLNEQHI